MGMEHTAVQKWFTENILQGVREQGKNKSEAVQNFLDKLGSGNKMIRVEAAFEDRKSLEDRTHRRSRPITYLPPRESLWKVEYDASGEWGGAESWTFVKLDEHGNEVADIAKISYSMFCGGVETTAVYR